MTMTQNWVLLEWLSIGSLQQHKLYSNTHKCLGHDSRGSAWLSIGSSLQPHELYSNTHKCLGHDSRGSVIAYFWHCMVTGERWEQRITKMGICTFLHYRVFALKACSLNASKKRKAFIWPKISREPKVTSVCLKNANSDRTTRNKKRVPTPAELIRCTLPSLLAGCRGWTAEDGRLPFLRQERIKSLIFGPHYVFQRTVWHGLYIYSLFIDRGKIL